MNKIFLCAYRGADGNVNLIANAEKKGLVDLILEIDQRALEYCLL